MRRRGLALLLTTFLLFTASFLLYLRVITTRIDWPNLFVYISSMILVSFLIILILRYVVLIWFSFLSHHEKVLAEYGEEMPKVSVIVPVYNEGEVIDETIRALLRLDYPRYEILFINDGSIDETYKKLLRVAGDYGKATISVIHQRNMGKAQALNAGIRASSADFIFCMDGDTILRPDVLKKMIRHFSDPLVGAVAGNVKVGNRGRIWTDLQALEYVEGLNMVRQAQGFFRAVNIIPGPCGMFRKKVVEEVGLYESRTFAEDCHLTLKILAKGYRVLYEPEAVALTEAPTNLNDLFRQRYRWTRGIMQSIRLHKGLIFSLREHPVTSITLMYMAFEALIWPIMNVFANLVLLFIAIYFGISIILISWWAMLTMLDIIAALYCVVSENESPRLILYGTFYRMFFILVIDICKVFSAIDEMMKVGMAWEKVPRRGGVREEWT